MKILITTYNRLWSLKKTIESLSQCDGFDEIPVYYFQDFGKDTEAVRGYIEEIHRPIDKICPATHHIGLKENTLRAFRTNDDFIWLQDDMEFAKDFLQFMTFAMNEYRNDKEITFISGYSPKIHHSLYLTSYTSEALGIWRNKFDVNFLNKDWQKIIYDKKLMNKYRGYSGDMYVNLLRDAVINKKDVISVFMNYYMFEQGGYCLHPNKNKLRHLISNSTNCKKSIIKKLNQETLEGFSRRIDTGFWMNKYPKYKRITRWLSMRATRLWLPFSKQKYAR